MNCVIDSGHPQKLPFLSAADSMSVEACLAEAEQMQYQYAGVEYGHECWMGNRLAGGTNGKVRTNETDCNMSCTPYGREDGVVWRCCEDESLDQEC